MLTLQEFDLFDVFEDGVVDESVFEDGLFTFSSSSCSGSDTCSSSCDETGCRKAIRRETPRPFKGRPGASYTNLLLYSLNSGDSNVMSSVLSRICIPEVVMMKYCYSGQGGEENQHSNHEGLRSLAPILGLENLIRYWLGIYDLIPDCVISTKTPARICTQTKEGSMYIIGIQFEGNSISLNPGSESMMIASSGVKSLLPFSHSNMVAVRLMQKNGSIITYVNQDEKIYRIDFYLEY